MNKKSNNLNKILEISNTHRTIDFKTNKIKRIRLIVLIVAFLICIPLITILIGIQREQHLDKLFNPNGYTDVFAHLNIDLPSPEGVTLKQIETNITYKCPKDITSGIYYIKIEKRVVNRDCGNSYTFHYWEKQQDYEHEKMFFTELSSDKCESYLKIRIKKGDLIEFEVDEETNLNFYIENK